jgi:hypothetical protein
MFCSSCGTQVNEKAQFCQKCGTAVGAISPKPAPSVGGTPKTSGRGPALLGWLFVLLALGCMFIPVPKEATTVLAFLLSWVGFSLVFPGGSVIIKAGKGAVGALIVAVFVGYIGDLVSSNTQKPAVDAAKINIDTLLTDYKTNEVGADQKYKGQVIETAGVLQMIKKDLADTPFVVLSTSGDLAIPSFQCALSLVGARQAAGMSPGQRVVVQGKIIGLMINVQAQNCIIVPRAAETASPLPAPASPAADQATNTAPPQVSAQSAGGAIEPPGWLGERQCCADVPPQDYNAVLSISETTEKPRVRLEVSRGGAGACAANIIGTLDIAEATARILPPFLSRGETDQPESSSEPCEISFRLNPDGSISVDEKSCGAYHGARCSFGGEYRLLKK